MRHLAPGLSALFRTPLTPVGMDLNHDILTLAATASRQAPLLIRYVESHLEPAECLAPGASVQHTWCRLNTRHRKIILSLPAAQLCHRLIRVPRMSSGSLEKLLEAEAADLLGLPVAELSFDYLRMSDEPESEPSDTWSILLCAARLTDIQLRMQLAESAGLQLVRLDVEPFALLNMAATLSEWQAAHFGRRVLLHISHESLCCLILQAGALLPDQPARHFQLGPLSIAEIGQMLASVRAEAILLTGCGVYFTPLEQGLQQYPGALKLLSSPAAEMLSESEPQDSYMSSTFAGRALAGGLLLGDRPPRSPSLTDGFIPHFNLLPARKQRRSAHRRRFVLLALGCLLLFFASLQLVRQWLAGQLHQQTQLAQQLEREISQLQRSSLINLTAIPAPSDLIWLKQWLPRRSQAERALQQLARLTPASVVLVRFQQQDQSVILSGYALSVLELKQFETTLSTPRKWGGITRLESSATLFQQRPVHRFSLQLSNAALLAP